MITVGLFLVIFVLGPLIFLRLVAPNATPRNLRALGFICLGLLGLGLAMRVALPLVLVGTRAPILSSMLLIWLAWIAVLALLVQRLRLSDPSPKLRRISTVIGALFTTAPWFGLAASRLFTV